MSLRATKPGHCEELDTVLNSDWGQSLCPALDKLLTWAEKQPSSPRVANERVSHFDEKLDEP
jgi:hypothetical protein